MKQPSFALSLFAWISVLAFTLQSQQPSAVVRQTLPSTDTATVGTTGPVLDLAARQVSYSKEGKEIRYSAPVHPTSVIRSSVAFDPERKKFRYTYAIVDSGPGPLSQLVMYLPESDTSREIQPKVWNPEVERTEIGDSFSKVFLGRMQRLRFLRSDTNTATSFSILSERRPGFVEALVSGKIDPKAREDMKSDLVLRGFLEEKGFARQVTIVAPLLTNDAGEQETAAHLYQGVQSAIFRGEIKRESVFALGLLSALQPAIVGPGAVGRSQIAALRAETSAERDLLSMVNVALGGAK